VLGLKVVAANYGHEAPASAFFEWMLAKIHSLALRAGIGRRHAIVERPEWSRGGASNQ
jgi:hypothetical protein